MEWIEPVELEQVETAIKAEALPPLPFEASDDEVEARNFEVRMRNSRPGRFVNFFDGLDDNGKHVSKSRWIPFHIWPQKMESKDNEQFDDRREIETSEIDSRPNLHSGDGSYAGRSAETESAEESENGPHVVLATCGQDDKPNKRKRECSGNCWKVDTPGRASKGRWLIRMRNCRACGRKPKTVTYINNEQYQFLMEDKARYEQFKRDIEAGRNSETFWSSVFA